MQPQKHDRSFLEQHFVLPMAQLLVILVPEEPPPSKKSSEGENADIWPVSRRKVAGFMNKSKIIETESSVQDTVRAPRPGTPPGR